MTCCLYRGYGKRIFLLCFLLAIDNPSTEHWERPRVKSCRCGQDVDGKISVDKLKLDNAVQD